MKDSVKRVVVIIFALCITFAMAAPAIPPTHAVVLPNHVVINEFEQNPVGGDFNNQWVEIYNPTNIPVNIGKWKIVTITSTSKTIPTDTIVPANGYYVFMFAAVVLVHNNEMITLKDASNNVIDVTAKKSSATASAQTWQRYANGVDTDSDGDWQFRTATKWRSNGGETVTMSISSSSITFGSDVTVSGTVNPGHITFVRIQASVDGGATWQNITIVNANSNGDYSRVIVGADVGSYLFRAVLPLDSGAVSGTVSLTVNKLSSTISVFAPKSVIARDSASIIGFISPVRPSVTVTLQIGMPNGTYLTRSATINSAGYFNYTFAPDAAGNWNVTASWSGDSRTQGATSSTAFFTVKLAGEGSILIAAILIVIPVVAVLLIALGLGLGRSERKPVQHFVGPVRLLPSRFPGRLIPLRRRAVPARVCSGCGGPLVYSTQYGKWYCPRCGRYI